MAKKSATKPMTVTDRATFERDARITETLQAIQSLADDLRRFAGRANTPDLAEALRDAADGIGDALSDADVPAAQAVEIADTDADKIDRMQEERHARILSSAEACGR